MAALCTHRSVHLRPSGSACDSVDQARQARRRDGVAGAVREADPRRNHPDGSPCKIQPILDEKAAEARPARIGRVPRSQSHYCHRRFYGTRRDTSLQRGTPRSGGQETQDHDFRLTDRAAAAAAKRRDEPKRTTRSDAARRAGYSAATSETPSGDDGQVPQRQ